MKKKLRGKFCHVRIKCNLCIRTKEITFCMGGQDMKSTKIEDYIGLIGGNTSRVRPIVLRQQQGTFLTLK